MLNRHQTVSPHATDVDVIVSLQTHKQEPTIKTSERALRSAGDTPSNYHLLIIRESEGDVSAGGTRHLVAHGARRQRGG